MNASFGDHRLPTRFWAKVARQADDCWLWMAGCNRGGYGQFKWFGKHTGAHVVALTVLCGPPPAGSVVDHLCHTTSCTEGPVCRHRRCVNPQHLKATTQRENLLRGNTLTAAHVAKTECPRGHPYDAANTYVHGGRRTCRACQRSRDRGSRRDGAKLQRIGHPRRHR